MLSDDQVDDLMDIFYTEAPYDYVLAFDEKKPKDYKGVCSYEDKLCVIYAPDHYYEALETVLHELAHARVQHKHHSDVWEKEMVNLFRKYKMPKEWVGYKTIMGPNSKAYKESEG